MKTVRVYSVKSPVCEKMLMFLVNYQVQFLDTKTITNNEKYNTRPN